MREVVSNEGALLALDSKSPQRVKTISPQWTRRGAKEKQKPKQNQRLTAEIAEEAEGRREELIWFEP